MLELHLEEMAGLAWCGPRTGDGQPMADLIAYIMFRPIGRLVDLRVGRAIVKEHYCAS